jgi:Sec-independent protein translocase protein TatA
LEQKDRAIKEMKKEMADKEEEMKKQMANELKEKDKQIQEMLQKLHQLSK